ncbi:hypothetical protein [Microbacterium sp.]|uniref:hypothetical protein n=1 Tax=Microbacterium sp. TaxID=51671 RepID=UPI0028126768|nr:hypothetical protein [Microbacterium sp.]
MTDPVLTHPTAAVVGTTDLAGAALFFSALGCVPWALPPLDRRSAYALYGLDDEARQLAMRSPRSETFIRLVETPHAAPPFRALDLGAYGLDFFTRDLALTMSAVERAGAHNITPLVPYGPERSITPDAEDFLNQEVLFQGPDEITVYITDVTVSTNHWPTMLAHDERINSELVMLCWVVDDNDVERQFWESEAGLVVVGDGYPDSEAMIELMYHPRSTPLRCVNISDAAGGTKMELMSYPEESGLPRREEWPLRGGFHGAQFVVDDVEEAVRSLPSATFGDVVEVTTDAGTIAAVTGTSPGGARFELWEGGHPSP